MRLPRSLFFLSALAIATVGSANVSRADDAPAQTDGEKADQLYRQGNEAYDLKHWPEAYELFLAAWKLKKSYDIAGNLGAVELKIGKPRDAAEHLAFSFKVFPSNGNPASRQKTVDHLKEARAEVVTVVARVNVDSADVLVDGVVVGRSPISDELFVEPGPHTIEAKLAGYAVSPQSVNGLQGSSQTITLTLARADAPVAILAPIAPTTPAMSSAPLGERKMGVVVTGAVLSLAGMGLGIGFAVASNAKASDADSKAAALQQTRGRRACPDQSPVCADINAELGSRNSLGIGARASFIAGGTLAVLTVGYVLLTGKSLEQQTGVRIAPLVDGNEAGLMMMRRW